MFTQNILKDKSYLLKHSKNSLQLVRNLTQVVNLQINDFSRLSAENIELFLKEMFGTGHLKRPDNYVEGSASAAEKSNQLDLIQKINNLPEICIEINMQKLQFRHS